MSETASEPPFIVGIGGTTRAGSSTERALRGALAAAQIQGARTQLFDGPFLAKLLLYNPEQPERTEEERLLSKPSEPPMLSSLGR